MRSGRPLLTVLLASLWLAGGLGHAVAGDAEEALPLAADIETVSARGALVLADGDQLCLAGIWVPDVGRERDGAAGWPSAWHALLEDGGLEDGGFFYRVGQPAKRDRYGCRLAIVETAEGLSLQQALIEQGWAAVDPLSAPGGSDDIDAMLALESRARQAGRGIWKDRQVRPKKAGELNGLIGTRQLVEGRVLRVFSNDRHVYLNFGADWRTDFTVRLDRKMIEAAAFNAADFDGKLLRIRGVLEEARGPLIAIQHPKQIEFLP